MLLPEGVPLPLISFFPYRNRPPLNCNVLKHTAKTNMPPPAGHYGRASAIATIGFVLLTYRANFTTTLLFILWRAYSRSTTDHDLIQLRYRMDPITKTK